MDARTLDPALLAARLAALNAEYAAAIDDDRLEAWPDFFADAPCVYRVTTADNHEQGLPAGLVYASSKGMLRDRVSAIREASVYERQRYRHLVGLPRVTGRDGDAVRAETPFMVARIMRDGTTELFVTGRYLDRVVEGPDGALRLAERLVVCDSHRIDTLLVLPL